MRQQMQKVFGDWANVGIFVIAVITLLLTIITGGVSYCIHLEQRLTREEAILGSIQQIVANQESAISKTADVEQRQIDALAISQANHEGRIEVLERADIERRR